MSGFQFKTPEVQRAWDNFIDVFACADGGVDLIKLRSFIDQYDRLADSDRSAGQIIDVIYKFNRLVEIATDRIDLRKQEN